VDINNVGKRVVKAGRS